MSLRNMICVRGIQFVDRETLRRRFLPTVVASTTFLVRIHTICANKYSQTDNEMLYYDAKGNITSKIRKLLNI